MNWGAWGDPRIGQPLTGHANLNQQPPLLQPPWSRNSRIYAPSFRILQQGHRSGDERLAGETRWSAWRISFQATSLWAILVAIGIVRDWSDFNTSGLGTWVFVLAVAIWIAGFVGLYVWMERRATVELSVGQTA